MKLEVAHGTLSEHHPQPRRAESGWLGGIDTRPSTAVSEAGGGHVVLKVLLIPSGSRTYACQESSSE